MYIPEKYISKTCLDRSEYQMLLIRYIKIGFKNIKIWSIDVHQKHVSVVFGSNSQTLQVQYIYMK